MERKLAIFLLTAGFLCIYGPVCAYGQTLSTDIANKKITLKMDGRPLGKIVRTLTEEYDVAIGFEESSLDQDHNDYEFETILKPPFGLPSVRKLGQITVEIKTERIFNVGSHLLTVNAEEKPLREVLDTFVRQMKNYSWEIKDGVVNIFPITGRDERFKALLEIKIADLRIEKGEVIGMIRDRLFASKEVTGFLKDNNLHWSQWRPDPENIRLPVKSEMRFSNMTVRDLLNRITKMKRGGWILKSNKLFAKNPAKEYIEIQI